MQSNILLSCGLALLAGSAHAAHPLITDDPGTQGRGNYQLEINSDWSRHNGTSSRVAALTLTYGAREHVDVFINVPYSMTAPAGVQDASLGAKWRVLEQGATSVALKPELLLASGDEHRGLGNGRTSAALLGIAAHEIGDWTLLGNIGVTINRYRLAADRAANRTWIWRASAAALYAVSEQWQIAGDIGVARNSDKSERTAPAYFLVGVIYSPTPRLDLDIGMR